MTCVSLTKNKDQKLLDIYLPFYCKQIIYSNENKRFIKTFILDSFFSGSGGGGGGGGAEGSLWNIAAASLRRSESIN
jgi:hypothetical protein